MRNVFLVAAVTILLASCGAGSSTSPKSVVNAFIEASKKGDVDGIKKMITSQDASLIEMGESLAGSLDSSMKNKIKQEMANDFREKTENRTIDVKDEKIDGDNATVKVVFTEKEKTDTIPFALKKENGAWKISLISTGMKASGMTQEQMDENMKKMKEGLNNMGDMKDSIKNMMKNMKGVNVDSLMKEGSKQMEQFKEAAEKAGH